MADCILYGSGGGGDIPLISRADWNALSTIQKQSYGLVAIQDAIIGYDRGTLVDGSEYKPIGSYIPNSDASHVICESYGGNFNPNLNYWGVGSSPVEFNHDATSVYPSLQLDGSVFIPAKTNNAWGYIDLSTASTPFTAYIIAKTVNAGTYGRIIASFANRSTNGGIMLCGSDTDIESWDNSTFTGISSADYIVGAIQFISAGQARGFVRGYSNVYKDKPVQNVGRYIVLGRIDTNSNTSYADPCDIYVKYVAVVNEAESIQTVTDNMDALYNSFLS